MHHLSGSNYPYLFSDIQLLNHYIHSLRPVLHPPFRTTIDDKGKISIESKTPERVYKKKTFEEKTEILDSFKLLLQVLSPNVEMLDPESVKIISHIFLRVQKMQKKMGSAELELPYELLPCVTNWYNTYIAKRRNEVHNLEVLFSELCDTRENVDLAQSIFDHIVNFTDDSIEKITALSKKIKEKFASQYDIEAMALFWLQDFLQDFLYKKILHIDKDGRKFFFERTIEISKNLYLENIVASVFFDLYLEFYPEPLYKKNIDDCFSPWGEVQSKIIYVNCHVLLQVPNIYQNALYRFPSIKFLFCSSIEDTVPFTDVEAIIVSQMCKELVVIEFTGQTMLTTLGIINILENCKSIRVLNISDCSSIDVASTEFCQHIVKCSFLEFLVLDKSYETNDTLRAFFKTTMPKLLVEFH